MCAVWCMLRNICVHIPMYAHKEAGVGLWVSCFILLLAIALKQCASLNLDLTGVYGLYRRAWLFK